MNKLQPLLGTWLAVVALSVSAAEKSANPVEQELARVWRKIDAHPVDQGVRELFSFALEATSARSGEPSGSTGRID